MLPLSFGDRDWMYPRVSVFVKPRMIINEVARGMGVNPHERKERGGHKGWYASVYHLKALIPQINRSLLV